MFSLSCSGFVLRKGISSYMQAIEMTVYSIKNISRKDQLKFVHKMYSYQYEDGKDLSLGVFEKFSSSLGFKPLDWHYGKQNTWIAEEIASPEGYLTPYSLLIRSTQYFNRKKELLSFIVDIKDMKHTDDKYNYNTLDMMIRFQEFLYKVYGKFIKIEFKFRSNSNVELKDWLLGYFYTVVAQGEHYDTECSTNRRLTKREKKYVLENISEYLSYKADILQYYCETCHEHDSSSPWHTELIDVKMEKKWEEEAIQKGLYKAYYLTD